MMALALAAAPGWVQAAANVWALWLFGENVEDRLGHGRFAAFCVAAGALAVTAQFGLHPATTMPAAGDAGAVAGVLGAHVALYPTGRVLAAGFVPFRFEVVEIPAVAPMAFWLLLVLIGGTSIFAVLGGFVAGAAAARLVARRDRMRVDWWGA